MSEHHYKANFRDIEFNLFEFLRVQDTTLGKGEYAHLDEETAREALKGVLTICENELAASFVDADREGLEFDGEGNVKLPESLKKSMQAWFDNEYHRFELPERLGGFGAPPSVYWCAWEMVAGANPTAGFYQFGTFIARVIDALGTEDQKRRFVNNIIDRHWGATMVLTEPDAGSDVGSSRTKARHVEGDVWELEGVKRFITNGDFDFAENIVHLVLARPEGAGPGTKGLSMFLVPKFWVNEDGSLGERNGAFVTHIEHKMGIKASATCELTLGEKMPCRGLLVGGVHDGIRQMFMVIEQARMSIGIKSMSTVSTAYLNALQYAKERVQGPDLAKAADKTSPRVRIIEHPDVRRMLMTLKSHAEGMRAMALFAASLQDQVALLGGHRHPDARLLSKLDDLLLPLIKGYSSEKGYELLALALQVFGGSGYCQDYPMEQYIRDQKIDSIYEGTTHIQALDLLLRKIAKDNGQTLQEGLLPRIQKTLDDEEGGEALQAEREALDCALKDVQGMLLALMGKMGESIYHVGLHGNRVLFSLAELVMGWLLIRHAALALEQLDGASDADKAFYRGKVESARFFAREVLPNLTLNRKIVERSSLQLMEMPEEAF